MDGNDIWGRSKLSSSCTLNYDHQYFEFIASLPILSVYIIFGNRFIVSQMSIYHKIAISFLVLTELLHSVMHLLLLQLGEEMIMISYSAFNLLFVVLLYYSKKGSFYRRIFGGNFIIFMFLWTSAVSIMIYLYYTEGYIISQLIQTIVQIMTAFMLDSQFDAIKIRKQLWIPAIIYLVGYICLATEILYCDILMQFIGYFPYHSVVDVIFGIHIYYLCKFIIDPNNPYMSANCCNKNYQRLSKF
eukprot:41260_1